jgi:hypothetical protein
MNGILHVHVVQVHTETQTGAGPGFMRPEAFTVSGPHFRKRNTKCEYMFTMRKVITANYKFEEADKYHIHHKILKNNITCLLINCLTHLS